MIECLFRGVAQLVEHRSPKPSAQGSSPCTPAKNPHNESCEDFYFFTITYSLFFWFYFPKYDPPKCILRALIPRLVLSNAFNNICYKGIGDF